MQDRPNGRVAVIIPFYQDKPGILARALDCVFSQTVSDLTVIVVDDESPISPLPDIALQSPERRARIVSTRQANGGPGVARNTGLELVPETAEYVAFLDSDDVWQPGHLETAVAALQRGYDFYMSDYTWPSRSSTRFAQTHLVADARTSRIAESLYELGGFFEIVLTKWPAHISATVIRRSTLGDVRFDGRLRRTSEDQMYFLDCALRTRAVVFSTQVNMALDEGMNMFRRQATGTFGFARSRVANAYFHRLVAEKMSDLAPTARRANARHVVVNAKAFMRSEAKSLLRHGKLHVSLYLPALRTFLSRKLPPRSPV